MWTGLLINALCLCGALALWARAKPRGTSVLLGAGIIAAGQVLLVLLLAGWSGNLRAGPVIALSAVASLLLVAWGYRDLLIIIGRGMSDLAAAWNDLRSSAWALVTVTLVVVIAVWVGWLGSLLPPTDYDGLAQFIPTATLHLQAANLARIDTPYRGILAFPASGSLFMAWTVLTLGRDTWIDLVQWPFWLLGGLGVFQLARHLQAGRSQAVMGSLVFLAAPVVILQARSDYVDVMLAGLLVAALALLFDARISPRWRAGLVGCALGVGVGVKYAGALYSVLLGPLALIVLARARQRDALNRFGDAVTLALPMLALGSYWYLANWHDLGNPVWPIQVHIGQTVLFPGVWTTQSFYQDALPAELAHLTYPAQLWVEWRELTATFAPDMRLGGLGPLWFVAGLPALVVMAVQGLRTRSPMPIALAGLAGGLFFLTPANWHTRYVLVPLAISGVAVGWLLSQLDAWPKRLFSALVVLAGLYGFGLVLAFGPISWANLATFSHLPAGERRPAVSGIVPASDGAMRWFDQNVPTDATIAYSWGSAVLYPFWDGAGQRQFVYVPPTGDGKWFGLLQQHNVQYLIAFAGSREALAAASDARFRPLFEDAHYSIYFLPT